MTPEFCAWSTRLQEPACQSGGRPGAIDMLAISLLWVACIALTNPFGAFPLNDDWAYAVTVQRLLETGDFRPIDWVQTLHLSHAAWGYLSASLWGWSDEVLRASTLLLSLLGVLAFYQLCRLAGATPALALVAGLVLAFNPIYYALSFTYMTDVPFAALTIIAAFGFAKCLDRASDAWLLLAVAVALACTLNRQVGLALPAAYAVAHVMRYGFSPATVTRAIAPLAVCASALIGIQLWLAGSDRMPQLYNDSTAATLAAIGDPSRWGTAARNALSAIVYVGLFLLPLTLLLGTRMQSALSGSTRRMVFFVACLLGGILISIAYVKIRYPLPWISNIIDAAGIGPFTLRDSYVIGTRPMAPLPKMFWWAATLVGLLAAALLFVLSLVSVGRLCTSARRRVITPTDAIGFFLVLGAAIYLVPVIFSSFFDRYLLPVVPMMGAGLIALLSRGGGHWDATRGHTIIPVAISILAMAWFSVAGTHDYLAWNRARWSLLEDLLDQHRVAPQSVDGGYEFNGRHTYSPNYVSEKSKSWWWVEDDTYVVAFGVIPGYVVFREATYTRWLRPSQGRVTLLKRNGH